MAQLWRIIEKGGDVEEKNVSLRWLDPEKYVNLTLPAYQSESAAGMDIAAAVVAPVTLAPGDIILIPTGFAVAIPVGYELQIRPRSGLAIRHGITIINSPGTIDADYRGEVRIGLINLGREPFTLNRGDRIAQMVLAPVIRAKFKVVQELDETRRANGGFGHTGV
jgi:dUTP pyrophosphatase